MIIKRIKVRNIRSYEEAEIEFPKGSVLLSGDIGAGKTSILLAIEFALFGLQPGQKGASLLRTNEKEGSVLLEIEVDGKSVVIERALKRGKSVSQETAAITLNGDRRELSVTELKNNILSILNYPQEFAKKTNLLYRFTVYTPQEEMRQIILESSDIRLDTLRHVFGIDKYKRIKENTDLFRIKLREEVRNKQGMIQDLEEKKNQKNNKLILVEKLNSDLIESEKELLAYSELRKQKELEIDDVQKKIDEKRKFETEVEKAKIMLVGKKETLSSIEKDKSILLKQIEDIQNYLAKARDLKKMSEEITSLKESISQIKNSQLLLEKEIKDVESKIEEKRKLENEIDKTKIRLLNKRDNISRIEREEIILIKQVEEVKALSFSKEQQDRLENEIKLNQSLSEDKTKLYLDLSGKIISFNSKISELSDSKKNIALLKNCPTCLQYVPEDYKSGVLRDFEGNISKYKKEINLLESEKQKTSNEIELLKNKIDELIKDKYNLDINRVKLKSIDEKKLKLSDLGKQKKSAEEDILLLEKLLESLGNSAFLLNKYDVVFEQKKKNLQEGISLEREKEMTIANTQKEIDKQIDQKDKINEKQAQIKDLETKKSAINKDLSLLEKHIETLKGDVLGLSIYDSIYQKSNLELKEVLRKEKNSEIKKEGIRKEIELTKKDILDISAEIEKKEEIKKQLNYLAEIEDWLSSSFLELVSFTEKNVMLKLKEEFSKLFNEWFNILVPDIFSVRLDDSFTPIIEQKDFELDYSFLSGGERTAIALAYRLALNQTINSLLSKIKTKDIVILDEPTDGFSEQQLDKMRDVLSQLKVSQLILVSHEAKIESFVENIIKLKKERVSRIDN